MSMVYEKDHSERERFTPVGELPTIVERSQLKPEDQEEPKTFGSYKKSNSCLAGKAYSVQSRHK